VNFVILHKVRLSWLYQSLLAHTKFRVLQCTILGIIKNPHEFFMIAID